MSHNLWCDRDEWFNKTAQAIDLGKEAMGKGKKVREIINLLTGRIVT